ncbi:MAG: hypothetical protein GF365_05115 [Candidatus Buchananbacteria bacterium]|nr:hypothetical protein [Candidatus Buchananbacteria bacterium]
MVIEISMSVLLIAYGVLVLAFLIFALVNLYHILKFGFLGFESFFVTFIFIAGTILVLFITYKLGVEIDWTQTIAF